MIKGKDISPEVLQKVKEKEFEILCAFDDFCKENDIKYSLAYGTLLGAVRHGGFIPWDDDIDIIMNKENFDKLVSAWEVKHPDNLLLQNKDIDHDYSQTFTKIRLNNTTFLQEGEENSNYHKGIFIDIFLFRRGPQTKSEKFFFKIKGLFFLLYAREFVPPKASAPVKLFSKFFLSIVPKSKHYAIYNKLNKGFEKKYTENTRPLYNYSVIEDFSCPYPPDIFDEYTTVEFESRTFPAIKECDMILRIWFDDYMQLPPEEERVWAHSPIIIDFERNYEDIKNVGTD